MQPYRRTKKPVRARHSFHFGPTMTTVSKAAWTLWLDIKSVWIREPPLPAFIRLASTTTLLCALILPLFYLLVPPFFTYISYIVLKNENLSVLLDLPKIPVQQKQEAYQTCKIVFKKVTFRVSMMVTLYDYVQTFRAIGAFNTLR